MDQNMMIYAVAGLAFLAIAGIGLAFAGGDNESAKKRAKAIASGSNTGGKGRGKPDELAQRRKKTNEMLDNLRKQNSDKKRSIVPQDVKSKLAQAGLELPVPAFYIASLILGVVVTALAFVSGAEGLPPIQGIELKNRPILLILAFFAGSLGLPRFILNFMIGSRHKKMVAQFADAIDIIVRGVKSGLPLNECLRIISKESREPLRGEFATLSDNLAMGMNMDRALGEFYKRVPLPEVNFFVIVLMIQSKAGGNLSEALGNLSAVIRSRKMMREKIKALSSEAKSSAGIIAALPFAVGFMVFVTTPEYIMELFITETGHMIIALGAFLMFLGIMTMRRMMNFAI